MTAFRFVQFIACAAVILLAACNGSSSGAVAPAGSGARPAQSVSQNIQINNNATSTIYPSNYLTGTCPWQTTFPINKSIGPGGHPAGGLVYDTSCTPNESTTWTVTYATVPSNSATSCTFSAIFGVGAPFEWTVQNGTDTSCNVQLDPHNPSVLFLNYN